jgi:prepilin-type N-terminal cleavage/methylation domain-containing protein
VFIICLSKKNLNSFPMKTTKKKGFTLIELLIVIAIIGILAVAFLPSLLGAPAKGRDAQRIASIQKIENFLVTEALTGTLTAATNCIDPAQKAVAAHISKLIQDNIADFAGVFPKDPQTTNAATGAPAGICTAQYGYILFATNETYTAAVYVGVELEGNANVECESIADLAGDISIDPGLPIAADKHACYIALIQ